MKNDVTRMCTPSLQGASAGHRNFSQEMRELRNTTYLT